MAPRVVLVHVDTVDKQQTTVDRLFCTYDELIAERRRVAKEHPELYVDLDACQRAVDWAMGRNNG